MPKGGWRGGGRPKKEIKKVVLPFRVFESLIPKIKKMNDDFEKKLEEKRELK